MSAIIKQLFCVSVKISLNIAEIYNVFAKIFQKYTWTIYISQTNEDEKRKEFTRQVIQAESYTVLCGFQIENNQ